MKIITLDGKEFEVKYKQNAERITVSHGSIQYMYPNFVGSKLRQNSSSSDKYTMTFAIHSSLLVAFKASMKLFVTNEEDAIEHDIYGKLTHIVLEHRLWGAIKGIIIGDIQYNTSSEADVYCTCLFQEHTPDEPIEEKDLEETNDEAVEEIDEETTDEFDVELSPADKTGLLKLLDDLNALYANIKNSKVIAAFNDAKAALNDAILNSKKIMNAIKKILALAGDIVNSFNDFKRQFDLLKGQATAIKNIPVSSFNMAKFNFFALSYNMGITSKTTFVSPEAQAAAAGIKTVPLN